MTLAEIMEQAKELSQQEQKELIKLLVDALAVNDESRQKHRLSDLRGLGAEIWQNIDAQEYVDGLRDEWDQRP